MGKKHLRKDPFILNIRSNYCNVLFNKYMYDEAAVELRNLVGTLEGQVYPMLREPEKHDSESVDLRINQLVANYYLLGVCMHLIQSSGKDQKSKETLDQISKNFKPLDFLARALSLCQKYCKNSEMIKNITNSMESIKSDDAIKTGERVKRSVVVGSKLTGSKVSYRNSEAGLGNEERGSSTKIKSYRTKSIKSKVVGSNYTGSNQSIEVGKKPIRIIPRKLPLSELRGSTKVNGKNRKQKNMDEAMSQIRNLFSGMICLTLKES